MEALHVNSALQIDNLANIAEKLNIIFYLLSVFFFANLGGPNENEDNSNTATWDTVLCCQH